MKKILLVFLLLLSIIKVKAYENDYFKIDIPSDYTISLENENIYKWDNDNKYIAITISSNSNLKYDIEKFTDKQLEKQKEYLESSINTSLNDIDVKVTVLNIEKHNINNNYFLEYDLYFPSKNTLGHDIYQKGRMYTTNNNIFIITYNTDNEINTKEEFKDIFDSFIILDTSKVDNTLTMKKYFSTIIVLGIFLGIIGYIKDSKKAKKA